MYKKIKATGENIFSTQHFLWSVKHHQLVTADTAMSDNGYVSSYILQLVNFGMFYEPKN